MTRRNLFSIFAFAPVLPWLSLKGVVSPCKKTPGFYVKVHNPNGTQSTFFFPTTMTCETPKEIE